MGELLRWAVARLGNKENPAGEARRALRLSTAELVLPTAARVGRIEGARFRRIVEARARGVPWPILEETTAFLDFEVLVPPGVFIPRPETEELAELAISFLRKAPPHPRALDIGTGTGVLALSLARARPDAEIWAVDISSRAVRAAKHNAKRLGLSLHVLRSDGFAKISGKFHLIVANPPYVAREELRKLAPEVQNYDPRRALDGGAAGLVLVRRILEEAPDFLEPGGLVLLEIAPTQKETLLQFAKAQGKWRELQVLSDLSGKPRFFLGQKC